MSKLLVDEISDADNTGPVTVTDGLIGDVTGTLTGNVTGNLTGNVTGNINGLTPQASNMQPYNILVNGSLDVWQRGTSSTATGWGYYTADRWKTNLRDGAGTASQYVLNGELNPFVYAHKLAITSAATTSSPVMNQITEDSRRYKGQTVTLSFYAKASKSITLTTVYDLVWANSSNASASTGHSLTTSWQRFTVTTTLPDPSGTYNSTYDHLYTRFYYPTSDTYDVYITGVQLEAGSSASPFQYRSYGQELALCQRYFQIARYSGTGHNKVGSGIVNSSSNAGICIPGVTMRASPTGAFTGGAAIYDAAGIQTISSVSGINDMGAGVNVEYSTGSGLTIGRAAQVRLNSSSDFVSFSAEL